MRTSNMVLPLEVNDVLSAHFISSCFQALKYSIRLFLLHCGHLYDNALLNYIGPNPNQQQYSTEDYYKVSDDTIVFFHFHWDHLLPLASCSDLALSSNPWSFIVSRMPCFKAFYEYAAAYGEEYARQAYGAYAPPPGHKPEDPV